MGTDRKTGRFAGIYFAGSDQFPERSKSWRMTHLIRDVAEAVLKNILLSKIVRPGIRRWPYLHSRVFVTMTEDILIA
jgi:hypothetical protein